MNGVVFCETDFKRQTRRPQRYRLSDFTSQCLLVGHISTKCQCSAPSLSGRNKMAGVTEESPRKQHHLNGAFWTTKEKRERQVPTNETLIIAILCCLCYFNALSCNFAFDDNSAIKENKDLRPETPLSQLLWNDFWGQPMSKEHSHKSYRPVCVFTFRLNYAFHQLRPFGYHLVNVLLHIVVSLLYLRFCRLVVPRQCAFLAALLFCIHPIHTEAVTSVVGRAEILSATFYLAALIAYSRATQWRTVTNWPLFIASTGSTVLATFSKEQGITAFAVCAIYEGVYNQKLHQLSLPSLLAYIGPKRIWKASSPKWIKEMTLRIGMLALGTLAVLALRLRAMHSQLPVFTRFDNPAAYSSSPVRQMTHNYLSALNVWLLLNPMHLCCDWTMKSVPLLESLTDARNGATMALYATLLALAFKAAASRRSDCPVITLGLSLLIFPFLPATNCFFFVGFVVAERILYIPSLGFCILVAYGMCKLHESLSTQTSDLARYLVYLSFLVLVVSHCGRTVLRNEDWKNEYRLFSSGIKVFPNNGKLLNNFAHVLEGENRYAEALEYFLKATLIQPDDLGAYLNVGRAYASLQKSHLAEEYFRKAKDLLPRAEVGQTGVLHARIAPSHLSVFLNLGNLISQNKSRLAEAEELYRQAIAMRPDYVEAYINRAEILLKMNRTTEAEKVYKMALHFDTRNPDIYYNLGVVAIEMGQLQQAVTYFDTAIRINPQHSQALLNFAIVVQDAGREDLLALAENRLTQLLTMEKANERVYFHLGMIAMNTKRDQQAEHWFTRAVQMREDFRSAAFNLALLFSNTGRHLEALSQLQRLIRHHPDHLKGLTLLCDILINHTKNMSEAATCYRRILKQTPRNIQAKHNLCVIFVEQGQLDQAEECLGEAAQLVPHQDYVERHLKIVRLRIAKLRQTPAFAP